MKTVVPLKRAFDILFICAVMLAVLCVTGSAYGRKNPITPSVIRDTILISKTQNSKKHKIKLYPNAQHKVIFFSASGERGRVYQLYVFDMEGKLSKQIQVRNNETTVLTNIVKGNYLFEVFSDDERIENGQLSIR